MSKRNTPQRRHNILALLNEQGEVVATTGNLYSFQGGYVGPDTRGFPKNLPTTVWWQCGDLELIEEP